MLEMTSKERIQNILQRKPVDRIGLYEQFWPETRRRWIQDGHIESGENLGVHFGHDIARSSCINLIADIDCVPEVVEETEDTVLKRDGNGALLRWHKKHSSTPEHVDFSVKERRDWEERIKPLITADPHRIDFEAYRTERNAATWGSSSVHSCHLRCIGRSYSRDTFGLFSMHIAWDYLSLCTRVDMSSRCFLA